MEQLSLIPEDSPSKIIRLDSEQVNLYVCGDENYRCCFCVEHIKPKMYYLILAVQNRWRVRRAHWDCARRVMLDVLGIRDEHEVSEDIFGNK